MARGQGGNVALFAVSSIVNDADVAVFQHRCHDMRRSAHSTGPEVVLSTSDRDQLGSAAC